MARTRHIHTSPPGVTFANKSRGILGDFAGFVLFGLHMAPISKRHRPLYRRQGIGLELLDCPDPLGQPSGEVGRRLRPRWTRQKRPVVDRSKTGWWRRRRLAIARLVQIEVVPRRKDVSLAEWLGALTFDSRA